MLYARESFEMIERAINYGKIVQKYRNRKTKNAETTYNVEEVKKWVRDNFALEKDKNMNTNESFYERCLTAFLSKAKESGVANKGYIFVPELLIQGKAIVNSMLSDPGYVYQCSGPIQLYYTIMGLSIYAGMAMSAMWHEDYSRVKNGYGDYLLSEGPADEGIRLLKKHFSSNISKNQGNEFFHSIFDEWKKILSTVGSFTNQSPYARESMLASFMLGVSMMLEKLGY